LIAQSCAQRGTARSQIAIFENVEGGQSRTHRGV
jgi:hypothetical protein